MSTFRGRPRNEKNRDAWKIAGFALAIASIAGAAPGIAQDAPQFDCARLVVPALKSACGALPAGALPAAVISNARGRHRKPPAPARVWPRVRRTRGETPVTAPRRTACSPDLQQAQPRNSQRRREAAGCVG